jgi:CheY-like chemotaxis protein
MNRFRVLIAGNRTQAREGLKAVLGTVRAVHVVGEAADGQEAMRLVKEQGRFATARPLPFVILATVAWIAGPGWAPS